MRAATAKARKCFALARSTTHAGERDAAVSRGLAILERAGLNPDDFDIPGRARKRPAPAGNVDTSNGYASPLWGMPSFTIDQLVREAMRKAYVRRHGRKP